jgi:flagellar basal-body rod protein FlgF
MLVASPASGRGEGQDLPGKACPRHAMLAGDGAKTSVSAARCVWHGPCIQGRDGIVPAIVERPMQNATYIALSSQMALQHQMGVVANNMANLSTPAFKGEQMLFEQYLIKPPGNSPLAFVQDNGTVRDLRQGSLTKTGNTLDLALEGAGYFAVQTPLGTRYTRNGHFQLDAQGQIVTSQGYPVLSDGSQPIAVASGADKISIGPDGTVSLGRGAIGKLQIVNFDQPQAVVPSANGLYLTDQAPQPTTKTKVIQGMMEESNVQPVLELTRMMAVSRASGTVKDFLDEESTRQRDTIDKLGKVS